MNARAELWVLRRRQVLLAEIANLQRRCRTTGWFYSGTALKRKRIIIVLFFVTPDFEWGINTRRIFIAGECSVVRAIVEFDRGHLTDAWQPPADASRQSWICRQGGLLPTSSFPVDHFILKQLSIAIAIFCSNKNIKLLRDRQAWLSQPMIAVSVCKIQLVNWTSILCWAPVVGRGRSVIGTPIVKYRSDIFSVLSIFFFS